MAGENAPRYLDALRFWLKLGFISFGGPSGQIAIMHTELVERRRWISDSRFLHALNYCMLLPGPEAQQLAIYVGWLLHRTLGGITAGVLFVLPSAVILWALSWIYVSFSALGWVAAIFYGLKAAVLGIVAAAVIRIGSKALKNPVMWTIAALAFVAIFFLNVPFPVIILSALVVGLLGGVFWRDQFLVARPQAEAIEVIEHTRPSWSRAFRITSICLALWWIPVLCAGLLLGWQHTIFRESIFFSKAALVTFGGAYAVLPYVAQRAVETHGWLSAGQMMDGLGLAETTPGPLIMVVQFVGFLGAWNHPGNLPPLLAATLGALLTTWVTFTPCFLWIFLGAPHIEQLRSNVQLTSALTAVTAAVVGVILNLSVWFGMHVLFPRQNQLDWFVLIVALASFVLIGWWRLSVVLVVLGGGLLGLLWRTVI